MSKKVKKQKTVEELLEEALVPKEEQPYEVPGNWVWVKMGAIVDINPSKKKLDIIDEQICSFVPMASVSEKTGRIEIYEERTYEEVKKGYTQFFENDILFAKITPCMENGKVTIANNLINKFGYGSTEFYVLRTNKHIETKFIFHLVRSDYFRNQAKGNMTGAVGQQRVPRKYLESYPISLPPFNEQKRIADKVERLLNKIDEAKRLIEEAKETFELRRAAILEKAFRGELTRKWREENRNLDSVLERFEQIKKERFRIAESKKEISEITEMFEELNLGEYPNEQDWLYLKSNMFCYNINCGGTPSQDISEVGEVPFLKVYNIVNNKVNFSYKTQYIPNTVHETKLRKSILKPNDIIMNIVGPPLKKIAIIPEEYPEMNMNQAIVRFRPIKYVLPKYLYYCLQYDETLKEVINETRGVVGQSNISVSQSRNLIIPIPSLAEQELIVELLEESLEREEIALQLILEEGNLEELRQSILSKAFRGELGTNDPNDENVIEFLKEVLQEHVSDLPGR